MRRIAEHGKINSDRKRVKPLSQHVGKRSGESTKVLFNQLIIICFLKISVCDGTKQAVHRR